MKLGLDGFQDQEVGTAESDVSGGRVRNRPAVDVRRDLRVEQFGEYGDLLGLPDTAAAPDIGLQNGDTIHSINGFDITTPDKALEVYTKVRSASNLTIDLSRRGKPLSMEYSIR